LNEPIVLGSSPSSGSTLLRTVLGRVPGIVSGGELGVLDRTHFFDADADVLRERFRFWVKRFAERPMPAGKIKIFSHAPEWGWEFDELIAMGKHAKSWHEVLQTFFGASVERRGGRRWLEKTPGNVFAFRRTREAFPDARFVHILRDGRDVMDSLMRRGHSPFLAATRWTCAVAAAQELGSLPGVHEVRYEALVREPAGEVERLCGFVGEMFDESLLGEDEGDGPLIGTWTASHRSAITDAAVGSYRDGDVETILAFLGGVRLLDGRNGLDVMRAAGYDVEDAPRQLTETEKDAAEQEQAEYIAWQVKRAGACIYPLPTRVR